MTSIDAKVLEDGLRLREAPNTSAAILGSFSAGDAVTILGQEGEWWRVQTPLGAGFMHGDFLTVDGQRSVNVAPPDLGEVQAQGISEVEPGTYVCVSGDILSAIGARLGLSWRAIARLNGLTDPFTLQIGQVLRLPGKPDPTTALQVLNPLQFDGETRVTSSSNQGHHTPFGGSRSCDLDIIGGSSPGTPVLFNVSAPAGSEVRGVVGVIGLACRSQQLSDGGHKVQVDIERRVPGGEWTETGAWVLYAHLDPLSVGLGAVVQPGGKIGVLGPPGGGEYNSSCATASHIHIEATKASEVVDEDVDIRGDAVMRIEF